MTRVSEHVQPSAGQRKPLAEVLPGFADALRDALAGPPQPGSRQVRGAGAGSADTRLPQRGLALPAAAGTDDIGTDAAQSESGAPAPTGAAATPLPRRLAPTPVATLTDILSGLSQPAPRRATPPTVSTRGDVGDELRTNEAKPPLPARDVVSKAPPSARPSDRARVTPAVAQQRDQVVPRLEGKNAGEAERRVERLERVDADPVARPPAAAVGTAGLAALVAAPAGAPLALAAAVAAAPASATPAPAAPAPAARSAGPGRPAGRPGEDGLELAGAPQSTPGEPLHVRFDPRGARAFGEAAPAAMPAASVTRRETHFAPVLAPVISDPAPPQGADPAAPRLDTPAPPLPTASQSIVSQVRNALEQVELPTMPASAAEATRDAAASAPLRVIELQLTPSALGTVTVTMRLSAAGLRVSVAASVRETAQRLAEDQSELSDLVRRAGFGEADISVEFAPAARDDAMGGDASSSSSGSHARHERPSRDAAPGFDEALRV